MQKSAVFLDRDGTIIRDAEYLADPAGVALLPGAVEGLKQLQAAGYLLVVPPTYPRLPAEMPVSVLGKPAR